MRRIALIRAGAAAAAVSIGVVVEAEEDGRRQLLTRAKFVFLCMLLT